MEGAGGDLAVSRNVAATTSASPTTTPTPSPTPTATYKPASAEGQAENVPLLELPEEAKKETKAGLEEASRATVYRYLNMGSDELV
ncbi:DUF6318 family protein [Arthrobacter roseus]|uniref:DUF6318 family protein n=1 Tax=Arthrobacter roseus TaxID=136274 RepID=UPI001965E484|nr:DUF6318 family protein [Arthrobacter roseus]MBM7846812.1 hypothetical protein [Arthrobacter roseus]